MNALTTTNIILFTAGAGGITSAIELAKTGVTTGDYTNFIGAGISAIVGLLAIYLYEKLPASTPPTTE